MLQFDIIGIRFKPLWRIQYPFKPFHWNLAFLQYVLGMLRQLVFHICLQFVACIGSTVILITRSPPLRGRGGYSQISNL